MLSRVLRPSSSIICQLNSVPQTPGFGFAIIRPLTTSKQLSAIDEGPERDLVNFPRPKRAVYPPPVRFGLIPDDWFRFFYKKTGVTGPYMFGFGLLTYVLSKEILVLEHEFWTGVSLFGMIIYANKKFGPPLAAYLDKEMEKERDELNQGRNDDIKFNKVAIEEEKKSQWQAEGEKMLFDVKRENVALQQEAVYRERLMNVYSEVKKRLDYQVEKQMVERNMQQKHMVNWITNRVVKSITPESEQENLKKCIIDLKGLAVKY